MKKNFAEFSKHLIPLVLNSKVCFLAQASSSLDSALYEEEDRKIMSLLEEKAPEDDLFVAVLPPRLSFTSQLLLPTIDLLFAQREVNEN